MQSEESLQEVLTEDLEAESSHETQENHENVETKPPLALEGAMTDLLVDNTEQEPSKSEIPVESEPVPEPSTIPVDDAVEGEKEEENITIGEESSDEEPSKEKSSSSNPGIMSLNTLMLSPKPPKTQQRDRPTPRSARYSSRSVEVPEDTPEIRRYKESAMELKPLPNLTDDIYDQIVASLSFDRKNRAKTHKFKDGQKLTAAIDHVRNCQLEVRKNGLQKEAESNFQRELDDFKQIQESFDNETKEMESKLQSKLDEQGKRIKNSHQKELEEHQALWKSESKIRQYNRASNRLVSLRKQLNLMLVQCRFDEAEQMEKVVFEQKSLEEAQSHRQMQHAYNEATKKLMAKQESEWDFYLTSSSVQMQQLVQKRAKLRRQIENKQKRIEAKAEVVGDKEKLWNKVQTQRLEELSTGTQNRFVLPSTKMTRKDILDEDQTTLSLPPLNFAVSITASPGKASSRRK